MCVGNACRSPMAEAIAQYDAADVIEPSSAGLYPLGYIAELTKQTLMKNGYSANELSSDVLTREAMDEADLIINMTGRPGEHIFRGQENVEDWLVEDPYGGDPETYQRVFAGIQRRVNQLALSLREKQMSQETAS
ncbi:MAG TPA: low molecular weight phosphatase family protein [Candidatus Dormibacteraeota bacterium]|nr:low molecular weight phosphatase family protein [Candidatus Dormibacteraeota bacterium]